MKILEYFEKAWIMAIGASLVVAVYNLITLRVFDNRVYFPIFCAMFCSLIWFNIRGQRRFREKMMGDRKDKSSAEK